MIIEQNLSSKNTVYLLCGLPGSGKSTWSEKFVSENPNTVWYKLDKEFFKKHKSSFYGEKFKVYDAEIQAEILEKVKIDLLNKRDVILDYGFWEKTDRNKYGEIIIDNSGKLLLIPLASKHKIKGFMEFQFSNILQKDTLLLEVLKKIGFEIGTELEFAEIDKTKSELISFVSHQLKTPLTIVRGYIQILVEKLENKNSEKFSQISPLIQKKLFR